MTLRHIGGTVLLLVGMAALVFFEDIRELFLFLSPDGEVSVFMWLVLRICLLSLAVVGVLVLLFPRFVVVGCRLDRLLVTTARPRLLWRIIPAAFLIRAVIVFVMPFKLWQDYASYDELGWSWATLGGYFSGDHLTAYWPPGYPFWLSRLYVLFGHEPFAGAVANVVLGTVTVLLSYLLISRLWGERIGRWTLLLMAVFPSQVLSTSLLASEVLFTPLFLASVLLFVMAVHSRRWWATVLVGGLMLGLATLTRNVAALFLLPVALYWLVETKNWRHLSALFLVGLAGFALAVTPWMIRNYHAVGSFCLSTNTGVNLFIGNQPGSGMGYSQRTVEQLASAGLTSERAFDSAAFAGAWDHISDRPGAFLARGLVKGIFLYASDVDALDHVLLPPGESTARQGWIIVAVLVQSFYLAVLLLAAFALPVVLTSRIHRSAPTVLVLSILAYWTLVHFVFFAAGRFHFPLIPILSALAAVALAYRIDLSTTGTSCSHK